MLPVPPPPIFPASPTQAQTWECPLGLLSGSPCRLPQSPSVWYRFTSGVRVTHHDLVTGKEVISRCQEKPWDTPSHLLKSSGAGRSCLAPPEEAHTVGGGTLDEQRVWGIQASLRNSEGAGDLGGKWDREGGAGDHEAASPPGCPTGTSQVSVSQPEPSDLQKASLFLQPGCLLAHTHTLSPQAPCQKQADPPHTSLFPAWHSCQLHSLPSLPLSFLKSTPGSSSSSFAFFLPDCNGLPPPSPPAPVPGGWREVPLRTAKGMAFTFCRPQ